MNQLNSVSNLPAKYNGPSTQKLAKPNTLVRSYDLVSYRYLSRANEAICTVRDQATGALRKVLGSHLEVHWSGPETYHPSLGDSFGKDAYLLELMRGGNQ